MSETLYGYKIRERDGRRGNPKYRTVDVKQLWNRHHEILNLVAIGHTQREVAKMIGVSPETVSNTVNSTLGAEELTRRRKKRDDEYDKLADDVLELTKKSLKVYNDILTDEAEARKLKKDTADTVILELSGMRAPTRIEKKSMHTTATLEEIEEFKRRGIAAGRESGMIVDVKESR